MIISLKSPSVLKNIISINCGISSPPLSGHIDLSGLEDLEYFKCTSNSLTGFYGYEHNQKLINITANNNAISNNIERLDNKPLVIIYLHNNRLNGNIPNLPSSSVRALFNNNPNLNGNIPPLSSLSLLQNFSVSNCSLEGEIPSLTACVKLKTFIASNQLGAVKLTGNIGYLNFNPILEDFVINNNQISSWSGGSVSASIGYFIANNNLFDASSIDNILQEFVNAGRTSGSKVLILGGSGNQAPSPAGIVNKNILISRGWTVTTN